MASTQTIETAQVGEQPSVMTDRAQTGGVWSVASAALAFSDMCSNLTHMTQAPHYASGPALQFCRSKGAMKTMA